jgi:predicted transcriptional regulator
MKYQVENSKFRVVFESNLSLEEAQDFIEESERKELEEFQKNKEVFRIIEMPEEEK